MIGQSTQRRWLVILTVAAILAALAELALPTVLGRTIDAAVGADRAGTALSTTELSTTTLSTTALASIWLVVALILVVVLAVAEPVRNLAGGVAPAQATAQLRHRLVRHVLGLGLRRAESTGDTVSRLIGGAADAGQRGTAAVLAAVSTLPVVGAIGALILIDPLLAAGYFAGAAVLAVLLRAHVRDTFDAVTGYQRAQADIAGRLTEALSGIRTIAAAATANTEVRRCLAPLPELSRNGRRTWHVLARSTAQSAIVGPVLQLSVVAIGGWQLAHGRLTPGALFAAVQYAALGAGVGGLIAAFNRVARARAGTSRVDGLLRQPTPAYGRRNLPSGTGRLEFERVVARVAGVPVLDGVDLVLPAGTTVAVVGRSGSGKSLLAALAARLTTPDSGTVRLDGVPLTELSAEALRREVGVAFERPALIGRTVADAVALGHERRDRQLLDGALRGARADGFVARLTHRADTPLSLAPLSGGEAQRLGLARAWHARRLLVLDDATSSLDTATEAEIVRVLTTNTAGRTQLIVAHRASTAARCDLVVWLDAGRIRATGTHRQLCTNPAYRAVFGGTGGGDDPPT